MPSGPFCFAICLALRTYCTYGRQGCLERLPNIKTNSIELEHVFYWRSGGCMVQLCVWFFCQKCQCVLICSDMFWSFRTLVVIFWDVRYVHTWDMKCVFELQQAWNPKPARAHGLPGGWGSCGRPNRGHTGWFALLRIGISMSCHCRPCWALLCRQRNGV